MSNILESGFESVVPTLLGQMGFTCHAGDAFDPDASGERESYHGVMLPGRLKAAVARINRPYDRRHSARFCPGGGRCPARFKSRPESATECLGDSTRIPHNERYRGSQACVTDKIHKRTNAHEIND